MALLCSQNLYSQNSGLFEDFESPLTIPLYIFEQPDAGDIIISEFMYHPPEGVPLYVEIKNISDKVVNLQDWVLKDNTKTQRVVSDTIVTFLPDSYKVLTPNAKDLSSIFGEGDYLEMSTFPSLNRTTVDQIRLIDMKGDIIDSLSYNPQNWKSAGKALERKSFLAISTSSSNWEPSSHPLGGTPGLPNTAFPDMNPPVIMEVQNQGDDVLWLIFDQEVVLQAYENPSSYLINHNLSVLLATQIEPDILELKLDGRLERGLEYEITVGNIPNIFGASTVHSSSFRYTEPVEADDVFINEFMYKVADGYSRYIEIYNPGSKALVLKDWTINNNTGKLNYLTRSRTILPPDSYSVLSPDTALLGLFPDLNLIDMGSRFQALKHAGDDIVLRNEHGLLLDSLTYKPDWGGDGVALERKTTNLSATLKGNWADSPSSAFGTPGKKNHAEPDTAAPRVEQLTVVSETLLSLRFTKSPTTNPAQLTENYQIEPFIKILSIVQSGVEITLVLATPLQSDTDYKLKITNIGDIFGNILNDRIIDFTWIKFQSPQERDVVINEFLYRPVEGGVQRFVEMFNRSGKNIDLNNWMIGRHTGSPVVMTGEQLPDGTYASIPLLANEYLVLTSDSDSFAEDSIPKKIVLKTVPPFSRLGDSVYLTDPNGLRMDSLHYEPEWGANVDGFSLQRIHPDGASNDPFNWIGSPEISPGEINGVFRPESIPPKMIFATVTSDNNIKIRFNKFILENSAMRFYSDSQELELIDFDSFKANTLLFKIGHPMPRKPIAISAHNFRDYSGNFVQKDLIPLAWPLKQGELVINEIMYRPRVNRYSALPDQSQYLELYNDNNYALSIEGLYLHDKPDKNSQVSKRVPEKTIAGWVPAHEYAVVYADTSDDFQKSRISKSFDVSSDVRYYRVDGSTLSLSATSDEIYIANRHGMVIDSVYYQDNWNNPNLIDTRGISLERIKPGNPGNDAQNWTSSANPLGGTPGMQNSVFAYSGNLPVKEGLTMDPNPFSPDGDGYEDHLLINYILEEPDFLMRVRIFDRYGRMIRTLTEGEPAGLNGQLIWDGLKDDRSENRVGIYIILFDVYNSAAGINKSFKETVVLARRL